MTQKKGDKPGINPLENLGDSETTNINNNPVVELSKEDKLLELVTKLSNQLKDQQQEIQDLKDVKPSGLGLPADALAQLIKEVRKGNNETNETNNPLKYYAPEDIDPEDVLPEPIIFYAYGTGYVITDNRINGKAVKTPFGNTIFFMHQATQKVKNGKHTDLYSYSTYPSHSKREVEWLKNHNRFGVHFFETANDAMETNSDVASRITKHLNNLNGLEPAQIVNIYRTKGLPNITDISKMKNTLALEAVKEEIQNDRSSQEKYFKDIFESVKIKETFNS